MSTSPHIAFANATSIELVPQFVVSKIFDILSDEQVVEIAEDYLKYQFKDKRSCLDDSITILSIMDAICSWCNASGFAYRHDKTDSDDIVTMRFDMGKKWWTFFGKVHEIMFRDFKVENSTVE